MGTEEKQGGQDGSDVALSRGRQGQSMSGGGRRTVPWSLRTVRPCAALTSDLWRPEQGAGREYSVV